MVMNSKYGFGFGFITRLFPWQRICVHKLQRMLFGYVTLFMCPCK